MFVKNRCADFINQPSESGWVITINDNKNRHITCTQLFSELAKEQNHENKHKCKCHDHHKHHDHHSHY